MAKVVKEKSNVEMAMVQYSVWRVIIIGILLGLTFYGLTFLFNTRIGTLSTYSSVAVVLTAALGALIMSYLRMEKTLIITLCATLSIWGFAEFTKGLNWYEILAWEVLVYCLAYVLFSWLAQYFRPIIAIIVAIGIYVLINVTDIL